MQDDPQHQSVAPDPPPPALHYLRGVVERERPFYSLNALTMYGLTLIGEIPVILARILLVAVIASIAIVIKDHTAPQWSSTWIWVALIPTFWSILALIVPFGSAWWWRMRAGGREPSSREQLAYKDAIELLQANSGDKPLPLPKHWFVLDTPNPDAAVVGNTLMLSRGLLETDHVPAVLAHELGHLGTPDGRLTAALNRLVILAMPFGHSTEERGEQHREEVRTRIRYAPRASDYQADFDPVMDAVYGFLKGMYIASLIAKGGLGLWLTRPAWGTYWRAREYKADQYAASLGQADELADFLEIHALIHDHPVPFMWLTEHTHPPTELRIDKLRNAAIDNGGEPANPTANRPLPEPSQPGPLTT
jgi:Zn-dependent protease with chaperone function